MTATVQTNSLDTSHTGAQSPDLSSAASRPARGNILLQNLTTIAAYLAVLYSLVVLGYLLELSPEPLHPFLFTVAIATVICLFGLHLARTRERLLHQQLYTAAQTIEKLQTSEEHYHNLFDNATDGFVSFALDGTLLDVNRGMATMLGRLPEELIGHTYREFATPEFWHEGEERTRKVLAGERVPTFFAGELIHKDGIYIPVEAQARFVLDKTGIPIAIQGIFRNITERAQAERALQQAHAQLEARVDERTAALTAVVAALETEVAERTRAEEVAQRSEERYRTLIEQASDGIFTIDRHGYVAEVNLRGCEMLGYTRSDILGRHITEAFLPEDLVQSPLKLEELRDGRTILSERRVRGSDGTVFPVEISAKLLPDGRMQAIARDITSRKQTEVALRESEERYRKLVESCPDAVIIYRDGVFVYVNPAAAELAGVVRPEDLLGRQIWDFIHPTYWDVVRARMQQIQETNQMLGVMEIQVIRVNGQILDVEITGVPFSLRGQPAVQAFVRDISERKRAERELRHFNQELEQRVRERTAELRVAKDQAEAADHLKSAFLATMSHELRTPLNSIIGFTGVILQGLAGPLTVEQTKQLGMVRTSAWHLLSLINEVLDISKIEAGQLEILPQSFGYRDAIDKVMKTVSILVEQKGLTLHAHIAADVDDIVSDRRRVEQILLNLLNNAIKFTEQGTVQLECRRIDGRIETKIIDTGIGIKADEHETIFQAFRQLDTGITRRHEGSGLGLAICKRLVEMLGGTIWVTSEWGIGSTFTFTLPVIYTDGRGPVHDSTYLSH